MHYEAPGVYRAHFVTLETWNRTFPGSRGKLPAKDVSVFDPVAHRARFIDGAGQPTRDRQYLAIVFDGSRSAVTHTTLRPSPLRLSLADRADTRVLAGLFVAGPDLEELGQTVHITAHVQALATSDSILASEAVVWNVEAARVLDEPKVRAPSQLQILHGIAEWMPTYELS